jgi:hypothetical protein
MVLISKNISATNPGGPNEATNKNSLTYPAYINDIPTGLFGYPRH